MCFTEKKTAKNFKMFTTSLEKNKISHEKCVISDTLSQTDVCTSFPGAGNHRTKDALPS